MEQVNFGGAGLEGKIEEYFANYGEDIQELVQNIQAESKKNGKVSYKEASRLMETAIKQDSDILIGIAYYYMAEADSSGDDRENVKICLLGCIRYLQGKGPYEYIARAYYLLGEVEISQNSPIMAMEYYESGLAVCEENRHKELRAMLFHGIGSCYYLLDEPESALVYYDKCLKLHDNPEREYVQQINYVKALIERAKCLLILKRIDKVKADKKLMEDILSLLDDKQVNTEADLFFALFYKELGDYDNALLHLKKAGDVIENGYLAESQSHVREYLYVLIQMNAYARLAEALKRLKPYTDRSRNKDYKLHMLNLQMRYTYVYMEEEELRKCTDEFFRLYEVCTRERNKLLIKNIEVRRQLRQIQEKQHELKLLNEKLLNSSLHDALTGLPNRGYLNEHAGKIFERSRTKGHFYAICLLDIDYFKQLNDKYGHMAGDKCLKAIGGVLQEIRNSRIFSARYGGDEFTLILYRMKKADIEELLKGIREKVRELAIPNADSEVSDIVTLSMGCYCGIPTGEDKMWDYFSRADAALYQAKYMGKDSYIVFGKEENDIIYERYL